MLSFLPSPILVIINSILIAINVIVIATPMMLLGIIKFLLPFHFVTVMIEKCNYHLYKTWVFVNRCIIRLTNNINWHITGDAIPNTKKSCIVISNHISWLDILFIGCVYKGNIPTTKFFMKHSLIYIPFAGLACYALGMPFLRRFPKEKLLKNPKLRNKDIQTTKAACKRLIDFPTTLINFVEGSRFTAEKAKVARSPYKYLLPPKVASLGVALSEIGDQVEYIFNNTFYYPDNPKKAFVDMMKGKVKNVYVNVEILEKTDAIKGNYLEDKQFKHDFTMYMRDLWEKKDQVLEKMHQDYETNYKNKQFCLRKRKELQNSRAPFLTFI